MLSPFFQTAAHVTPGDSVYLEASTICPLLSAQTLLSIIGLSLCVTVHTVMYQIPSGQTYGNISVQ